NQQNSESPYRSTTCGEHVRWILDPKIAGSIAANMMALPEQILDVSFDFGPVARIGHLDRDVIQGFAPGAMHGTDYAAFCGRQRNEEDIVLAESGCAQPFFVENADDRERHVANSKGLSDACAPIKKLIDDHRPHDGDFGAGRDLVARK